MYRQIVFFLLLILCCSAVTLSAQEQEPAEQSKAQEVQPAEQGAQRKDAKEFDIDNDPDRPFRRRFNFPEFPKDTKWLNTSGPLRKRDLSGKFVLIDFWTYCCINCIHVLPSLDKLEKKYDKELVVIGCHSAKFDTEKDDRNITEAILRYEIAHPVINDHDHAIWDSLGVRSWPTMLLLDPQGKIIWANQGETRFEELDNTLSKFIKYYDAHDLIDRTPIHIEIAAHRAVDTPLRFPGKVLADAASNRLFISDSNHNRIVITNLAGELSDVVGSGAIGKQDGDYRGASFDHQQGMALIGEKLYVADTENHLIRLVDLKKRQVTTVAGTGEQAKSGFPGYATMKSGAAFPEKWVGKPSKTAIASPWALWVHKQGLYIAMAGPHQIWKMKLDESEIGPFAGNGREDIVDGDLLPRQPYQEGYCSFAQPSGLTSDGTWLYVADSEGSSIRAVPFDPEKQVPTVIGTAELPYNRLFTFGDVDGKPGKARLQHALGVVYHEGKIYVADTYNNKVKVVDAKTGHVSTFAGTLKPGTSDDPASFDEPAGISLARGKLYVADTNNHLIRTIDLETRKVDTLKIAGLKPPATKKKSRPDFARAQQFKLAEANVEASEGSIQFDVKLGFPNGWKLNALAPMKLYVDSTGEVFDKNKLQEVYQISGESKLKRIALPVNNTGTETVRISAVYYYCQEGGEGLCKIGMLTWTVPVNHGASATSTSVQLLAEIKP